MAKKKKSITLNLTLTLSPEQHKLLKSEQPTYIRSTAAWVRQLIVESLLDRTRSRSRGRAAAIDAERAALEGGAN